MNFMKLFPLRLLNFVPDKLMLYFQYFFKTGRLLNLKKPTRYTEKIQYYKLNYRNDLVTKCSDKVAVREYVKEKGFESILNKVFLIISNESEIYKLDFDKLPLSFAIKLNTGSGHNIFIKDKNQIDKNLLKRKLSKLLKINPIKDFREWGYYNIKPKIIFEKTLEKDKNGDLPDYKFFCFNGEVKFMYLMINYTINHKDGQCSFYDTNFTKLPFTRSEYRPISKQITKPSNFDEMVAIAKKLSEGFPHVRVDFYNENNMVIFGEMTFYPASGYTRFTPDKIDFYLGSFFSIHDF
jgi:hypothetical protein